MTFVQKTLSKADPLLSVVMPVYNGEKYLAEAIESVLSQSYSHFEFIIIDDGSTDGTELVVSEYVKKDARIRYLKLEKNAGISNALNIGIKFSKGEYVVRMDCDDIACPDRFSKQWQYFRENAASTDILGSYFCLFYDESPNECMTIPVSSRNFHDGNSPVHHPTCMIKRDIFFQHGWYDSEYDNAEDVDLWFRWFAKGVRFSNLEEVLYKKRVHKGSVSVSRIKHQVYIMLKINLKAIFKYRIKFTVRGYLRIFEQALYLIYLSLSLNKIYARGKKVTS